MWESRVFAGVAILCVGACATAQSEHYRTGFGIKEIAVQNAQYFDVTDKAAKSALKPVFEKYGDPKIYITGNMSSVDNPDLSRLYGVGVTSFKLKPQGKAFWAIKGEKLTGLLTPIKTAHLVYETADLTDLEATLSLIGDLNKRGQIFTIFERQFDAKVVITINRSEDIPEYSQMREIKFPEHIDHFWL